MDMQTNVEEAIRHAESRLQLAERFIRDAEDHDARLQEWIREYWQTPVHERDPKGLAWHERQGADNALSELQMLQQHPSFAGGRTFAPFPSRWVRSHGGGSTSAPFPRGGGYYGGW
eukprot:1018774-Rhodomonas_salina.1